MITTSGCLTHFLPFRGGQGNPAPDQGLHGFGTDSHAAEHAAADLDSACIPEFCSRMDKMLVFGLDVGAKPDLLPGW